MQQHHYDIEQLFAKIGRSRAYVYARLKLLALDKKSREAFYAGKLTAATALLLARIPVPALQQDALKAIAATWNGQPLPFKEAQRHIQDRYMRHDPHTSRSECTLCVTRTGSSRGPIVAARTAIQTAPSVVRLSSLGSRPPARAY